MPNEPPPNAVRAVREIVDIPTDLCEEFSSRRLMINDRYTGLAKQFQTDHGREPTTVEALALYERPTWKPAPPNTNHGRWPNSGRCGAPRPSRT